MTSTLHMCVGYVVFCASIVTTSYSLLTESEISSIDRTVSTLMKCRQVPGMNLAVVKHQTIVLKRGYGVTDLETRINVTADTWFPMASLSKEMTATLLAIVINEKGLQWETKIKDILQDFELGDDYLTAETTLNDIVCHRTELARNDYTWVLGEFTTFEQVYSRLRYFKKEKPFRTEVLYNNIVYSLAGKILQKLGGKSWDKLMKEKLWNPLGMTSSTFYYEHAPKWEGFPKPYMMTFNNTLVPVDQMASRYVETVGPAGSIVTTANDMAKYLEFLAKKGKLPNGTQLLPENKLDELFQPLLSLPQPWNYGALELPVMPVLWSTDTYAKGWTTGYYRAKRVIFHFGNLFGYDSLVSISPEEGHVIYTSTNGPKGRPAIIAHLLVHNYITDLLLRVDPWLNDTTVCTYPYPWQQDSAMSPGQIEVNKTIPSVRPFVEYTGTYGNLAWGNVTILVNETVGCLQLNYGLLGRFHLYPQPIADRFSIEPFGHIAFMLEMYTKYVPLLAYVQFSSENDCKHDCNKISSVTPTVLNYGDPPVFMRELKSKQAPNSNIDSNIATRTSLAGFPLLFTVVAVCINVIYGNL